MDSNKMVLETNLDEIKSWTSNLTRKKLAFIGTGILVLTVVCVSVVYAASAKSLPTIPALSKGQIAEKMKLIKDEINWVNYNSDNYSLVDAFAGGTGSNGKSVYVCRALNLNNQRNKEMIPGTFDPTDATCKVPFGDKTNSNREFELLATKNPSRFVWEAESDGNIKTGAVVGGLTAYAKELYVSRFEYSDFTVLGDLYPPAKKASGPVKETQHYTSSYEVLCLADYAF